MNMNMAGGMDGMGQYPQQMMDGMGQGQMPQGQPNTIPQFSFRTMLRFVTELVAVIQGVAMIMAMITGWLKDQQAGEPGPVGKFFAAVKKRLMRLIFGDSWSTAAASSLDGAWSAASKRSSLSWTQRVIGMYLAYAIMLELKNYWQNIKNERLAAEMAPQPVGGPYASAIPAPLQSDDRAPAGNLLEFYVNKQRELYQQRRAQEVAMDSMEMGNDEQ